jgi:hypothetical protein
VLPAANAQVHISTDSLFNTYYQVYQSENDPVEVSLYYQQYKAENYSQVIKATPEDYLLQGANDKQQLLTAYMNLYKGISYIELNKSAKAKSHLEDVLNNKTLNEPILKASATWYLVLVNLHTGDLKSCKQKLLLLVKQASPYQQKAKHLLISLDANKAE